MISKSIKLAVIVCCSILFVTGAYANAVPAPTRPPQEISEKDGLPVLIKHLPDWENRRNNSVFATNIADLKDALGQRPLLDLIDFAAGTEAVTAPYDAGKLLIIEYTSPQGSVDADNKFTQALAANADGTVYRRIGNYNVLVFDATDAAAANALIDQVKYEKDVQWLGNNPFRISAERNFVMTTTQMFISTFLIVVMGIGLAVGGGLLCGYVYYRFREQKRAAMPTFSDAGGMTRLNLDGFTPEISSESLMNE